MKAISQYFVRMALRCGVLTAAAICTAYAQTTLINLGTQGRNIDFTNDQFTRPIKTGTSLPTTCSPGDLYFKTNATAGQNLYGCPVANTWAPQGVSTPGLADPGSNGLVIRSAPNTTTVVSAPSGTVVGTTDVQTLTNKSISALEINSGTLSSAQMPALSGDVSTAAGTTTTVLANVNASPGTYGDATHSIQVTVDSKGRVTGISQLTTTAAISSGPLSAIASSCNPGLLYFATDQPAGQQIYACSSSNTWTQLGLLGPSGALLNSNGAIDINTAVVPRLAGGNTWTGANIFQQGLQMVERASCPTPSSGNDCYYTSTADHALHKVDSTGSDTLVSGSGSGGAASISIQSNGTPQGTASTINLSSNLNATISGGVATITANPSEFTGTQGSVPFVGPGGSIIEDNTHFYWDDTNHRLGINQAAPSDYISIADVSTGNNNLISLYNNQSGYTASLGLHLQSTARNIYSELIGPGSSSYTNDLLFYDQTNSFVLGYWDTNGYFHEPQGVDVGSIKSATSANTDLTGELTFTNATTSTVTFTQTYGSHPECVVTPQFNVAGNTPWVTYSGTISFTINFGSAASGSVSYVCVGRN